MQSETKNNEHVLLLDQEADNCSNLSFLLRLAAYRVTVVGDIWEAVNLVHTSRHHDQPVELFLISNCGAAGLLSELLLSEVLRVGRQIPVLVIDRPERRKESMEALLRLPTVRSVRPDRMLRDVEQALAVESFPAPE